MLYGVQFHPEALPGTTAILDNFIMHGAFTRPRPP